MHILLIEQHRLLARALKWGLEEEGFVVTVAANGAGDLWALLCDVDGIILDLDRPEETGFSCLRRWRRDGLATPVLLLTAGREGPSRAGNADCACDLLTKPFELEELFSRLRRLLRQPAADRTCLTCRR